MKKYDVVALGELLIDFTQNGTSEQGNSLFEANPGGAPCNVLAMVSKLGHKTAFIGKVGKDSFGKQLKDTLEEVGIDATNLTMDEAERRYSPQIRSRLQGSFRLLPFVGQDIRVLKNRGY